MIIPLYVFDICGTIFKSNTTFDFLTFWLSPRSKYYSSFDKIRKTFIWKVINKITRTYFHVDITRVIALRFLKGIVVCNYWKVLTCFTNHILSNILMTMLLVN